MFSVVCSSPLVLKSSKHDPFRMILAAVKFEKVVQIVPKYTYDGINLMDSNFQLFETNHVEVPKQR